MSDYWTTLSENRRINVDNIIAGLHNVELLEGMSQYTHRKGLYFPKVISALKQLPSEHWDAALAVFGSVVYIPKDVLSATMNYLWWSVRAAAAAKGEALSEDADDVLIMEVDQDGLVPDFARQNGLSARLNANIHPRLNDVQSLRSRLAHALHGPDQERQPAAEELRRAARKRAWIVLIDKALSGQSLLGDLQKIVYARDLLLEATGRRPMIYVAAQVATSAAEATVEQWIRDDDIQAVDMLSAIRLDDRARVISPHCRLFEPATREMVVNLCTWFDEEVVARDRSLRWFREKSGGSLAFGYQQTGITLVDHRNTPTNSLPLLWFNATDPAADYEAGQPRPKYVGPFPRVHSRRGPEDPRWSETTRWADVLEPATARSPAKKRPRRLYSRRPRRSAAATPCCAASRTRA